MPLGGYRNYFGGNNETGASSAIDLWTADQTTAVFRSWTTSAGTDVTDVRKWNFIRCKKN